jgi:hypothetical protein
MVENPSIWSVHSQVKVDILRKWRRPPLIREREDSSMTNAPKRNHGKEHSKPSHRGKRLASLGLMVTLGLLANSPAEAQALDGTAIQKLALQGTWVAEHPEFGNWSWNKDNTVCLRLSDTQGNCADTGTWVINDNVICYELAWWGKSTGVRKNCFTVQALGDGRYETLYHGGAMVSTMHYFKVLE